MKQRGILFSTPMVKAIDLDLKTQTRRIIKPQPDDSGLHNHTELPMSLQSDLRGFWGTVNETGETREFKCPQGRPGDQLYVRETWLQTRVIESTDSKNDGLLEYQYKAADSTFNRVTEACNIKWKPSLFMPKEAARIWLEIEDVRVERLNDCSRDDAQAEGIPQTFGEALQLFGDEFMEDRWQHFWDNGTSVENYAWLWDKINGKGSWESNPWVWVIQFKKIKP